MSFGETLSLCVKGVKHRMLRSVLTLAVVVLAVAFFMFLLSESMFLRATGRGVQSEIRHERISQQTLTKFFSPATELITVRRLAEAWKRADAVRLNEFVSISKMTRLEIDKLAEMAQKEVTYINWLDSIPTGKRTVLIRKFLGRSALAYILADQEGFRTRLAPMIDLKVPGKREGFDAFLSSYPAYAKRITEITTLWNSHVEKAVALMDTFNPADRNTDSYWIATAPEATVEAWRTSIVALGFEFNQNDLKLMREQIRAFSESAEVFKALNSKEIREAWSREFREGKPSNVEKKMESLTDKRAIKIFAGTFTKETLERVYLKNRYDQSLVKLERKLSVSMSGDESFLGLSGRQLFLLSISFVVCMVGISNAMLMSITERFREIATMKCLGATDSYILMQFMMEAGMQGFAGGLLGVVIGFVIATLRSFAAYGTYLFAYWPWVALVGSGVVSLAAGVLLAILASMQPSWSASRMAPMEAMRVE